MADNLAESQNGVSTEPPPAEARGSAARTVGAEKKESSSPAIILLIVLAVVAWFSIAHGLQTLIYLESHHWASSNPLLSETPQVLPQPGGTAPAATRIEHYNYEFYLPWKPVDKDDENPNYATVRMKTGEVVVFFNPDTQVDALQTMKSGNSPLAREYGMLFADSPLASNYDLYKAVYSATPSETRVLMSRIDAERIDALLLWKMRFGMDAPNGLYTFDWGGLRGIQYGDPARGPVAVRAFDTHERQFRFLFLTASGSDAKLTQDVIGQIVLTTRTAY